MAPGVQERDAGIRAGRARHRSSRPASSARCSSTRTAWLRLPGTWPDTWPFRSWSWARRMTGRWRTECSARSRCRPPRSISRGRSRPITPRRTRSTSTTSPRAAVMDVNYAIVPVRPAGGAWSNVRDVLRYVTMELGGRVARRHALHRRDTAPGSPGPRKSRSEGRAYGMGLMWIRPGASRSFTTAAPDWLQDRHDVPARPERGCRHPDELATPGS